MDNSKNYDVVIIGGGIAGISALHRIKRDYPQLSVILLEKENKLGGMLSTSFAEGYLLETGPTAYLKSYAQTMKLVEELGLTEQVIFNKPGADHRYIYREGAIHPIPESPLSFLTSPLFSFKGKMRILLEPMIARSKRREESVFHFAKRRFGIEVASTVMDAMVSGVCAGDVKKLDIHSLFPKIGLIEKKVRSFLFFLLLFKLKSREKDTSNHSVTFRSLRRGMGQIGEAATDFYSDSISLSSPVFSIERDGAQFHIHSGSGSYLCRQIIVATPAPAAAFLLKSISPLLHRKLSAIPYASITTCQLGYRKEQIGHPLDGFGFLVPRHRGVRILGGLFASGLFDDRAPESMAAVKVYIGGSHDPEVQELSEQMILDIVEKEISPILKISGGPVFRHLKKIDSAIPQYHLGHQHIVAKLQAEVAQHPHIALVGNYISGISVNEAIRTGQEVALDHLLNETKYQME